MKEVVRIGYCEKQGRKIPLIFTLNDERIVIRVSCDPAVCRYAASCGLYRMYPLDSFVPESHSPA